MQRIRNFLASLERDQRGLTTVEYAIVLCVIVAVSVGLWKEFGDAIYASLEKSSGDINTALTEPPP